MTPGTLPLKLYRGDTYRWRFQFWSDTAKTQPIDMSRVIEVRAEIRDQPSGTTIVPMTGSVTLPNIIDMTLAHSDSRRLPDAGVWDLQLTYNDGSVATPVAGPVAVTADVTDSGVSASGSSTATAPASRSDMARSATLSLVNRR